MTPTPLADAADPERFGGKGAALALALRAGLPVPAGWALDHELVEAVAAGDPRARHAVLACVAGVSSPLAVRSSAIGEDGAGHSFAGQHLTRLGIAADAVVSAVVAVRDSVYAPSALAYRARRGITAAPRAGVVIQELVPADVAAVVFTRDPVRGHDVVVIEASLGLGETVVNGSVVPDRFILDRQGRVLEQQAGDKDCALVIREGRLATVELDGRARTALCLQAEQLRRIMDLIQIVDGVWPGPHDLEIAFQAERLFLLQRRPLTVGPCSARAPT